MKRSSLWWWVHNVVAHGLLMGFLGQDHPWAVGVHDWSAGRAAEAERQEGLRWIGYGPKGKPIYEANRHGTGTGRG